MFSMFRNTALAAMRRLNLVAFVSLAFLIAPHAVRADVIVYQQLPGANSNEERVSSTLDFFGGSPGFRTADDFMLSANALITDVHWWGRSVSGGNSFTFTFYANNGGVPGAILGSRVGSLSATTVNVGSSFDPVTFYSSDLVSPFSATAGTTYWISIFNQAANASWVWLSASSPGDGSVSATNPGGPPWPITNNNMAFELTSAPEPASLTLLAVGLAGLGMVLRTRRA
jgi:hypothetical protein